MFDIILYQPEIPANTGNIIRLCANAGARLHLIEPLGFFLDDKRLIRAGLDYHEFTTLKRYPSLEDYCTNQSPQRIFPCSTKAQHGYTDFCYQAGDAFLFGPESRGLPEDILAAYSQQGVRIPMRANSRSLNLNNAVAIILFEAWRQIGFL